MMDKGLFRSSLHDALRVHGSWAAFAAVIAAAVLNLLYPAQALAANWPMFGQNPQNTANQDGESKISTGNVSSLAVKWSSATTGDVSARAAVVNGVVYFPDWGPALNPAVPSVTGTSTLYALNADTGVAIWSHVLTYYGLPANTHSRTSPAVVPGGNSTVYVGTQEGAWLLAINAKTGELIWKTQLESPANDPFAIITTSPTVVGNTVYTGIASSEEGVAGFAPGYPCCKARGSVVAVNAKTGAVKWQTYMVPVGYSGAGVWGSNLPVDEKSNTVYASTGNNYSNAKDSAPSSDPSKTYGQCIAGGGNSATCASPDNHVDSILALDASTGAIKWARKFVTWAADTFAPWPPYGPPYGASGSWGGSDDFNVGCFAAILPPGTVNSEACPSSPGPDYDFGSAPNLISYKSANGPKTILGAGQKSGIYYALDPQTGAVLWQTQVAPGSALGGMEWGSATDGKRIYVQNSNLYGLPNPGTGTNAGTWSALDPATGQILWQTADPNGAVDIGPMTVANGVVYAPSMGSPTLANPTPQTMVALNAATGANLWSFNSGESVNAGATVVNGIVYWGSGYAHLGFPGQTGGNKKFYAFSLNGN